MELRDIIPKKHEGIYVLPDSSIENLNNFKVLAHSVDTINQFIECRLKKSFFKQYEVASFPLDIRIKGQEYVLSKMGKTSGYQYSLQSKDLGLQILFKSFYKSVSEDASHIKVAMSPHFLALQFENQKQKIDDVVAHLTHFDTWTHFSIHYAIDFQLKDQNVRYVENVFPNFQKRLKGFRAQKCYVNESLNFEMKDLELVANGRKGIETITMGAANAFQLTCYRKDLEIVKTNKEEYFRDVWGKNYDDDYPVFRLELRLHQRQLETYKIFQKSYLDYVKEGDFSLIRTFMIQRARLMDSTGKVFSPLWYELLLSFDSEKIVQRERIKKDKFKTLSNSNQALGNMISLYLKLGVETEKIVEQLKEVPIIRVACADKFGLDSSHPEIEFQLKEKLQKYVEKRLTTSNWRPFNEIHTKEIKGRTLEN